MEEQELRPHGRRRQPAKLFSPTPPRAVNIGERRRAAGPLTAFEVHEKTRKNISITLRPLPQQPAAVPSASTGALAALSGTLGLAGALAARRRRNVTRQKQEQIHEG